MLPKNNKNASRNSLKTIFMENRFLQYLPCENNDSEVPNVDNSSHKALKKGLRDKHNNTNKKHIFGAKNLHKQVPKSFQKRLKSCHLQLRVHPADSMVLQGRPEVLKWLPKVLPWRQNGITRCFRDTKMVSQGAPGVHKLYPEMSKRKHRAFQMAPKAKKTWDAEMDARLLPMF